MNEIASRYGLALYSLAQERNEVLSLQQEVKELRKVFKENPDFIVVLNSSFLTVEERNDIIDKTLKGVDIDIVKLIKIIVRNNRANYLLDVLTVFNSYCNESRGVDEGLVYSVIPIEEKTLQQLEKKISQLEGVEVELTNRIDQNLIGGLKVVIRGHIYDGSIKNKLENMKIDLLKKEGVAYEN